jgi:Fe-S cluster biogenesis protein NfuA
MATWMRAVQVIGRRAGVRPMVQEGERVAARRLMTKSASKDGGLGVGGAGVMHQGWSFSDRTGFESLLMPPVAQRGTQRRGMFIQVESTPNPQSLMFYPGKPVMEVGSSDFPNARAAMASPLSKALFTVDGVVRVFFGADFVTVTKAEEVAWDALKPEIFAAIMDFYSTKQPLFYDAKSQASDTAIDEDDDETVAMIKELLETRIRPAVQDDGGDIEYRGFNPETGIVSLKMQGACSGCPSSAVTLKSGIENMLMHYVSEVQGVEEVHDGDTDDEGEVQTSEAG